MARGEGREAFHAPCAFSQNDPLSAGWQRVEGGVFNAGIAILRTSSLSLYFVGAILPNETTVYDDIVEELQCLEDEVDPQVTPVDG